RKLHVLRGHKSPVCSVAFSSDGMHLAAWGQDGTIKIWDVSAGRAIGDVNHPSGLSTGAWSPNDQLLAAGHNDGTVTISGVPLTLPSPPSPGGEGGVRGTSAGSKITTLRGHADTVFDLAWSPDSARLVSSSGDFRAKIWEVASGKMVVGPLRHSHGI